MPGVTKALPAEQQAASLVAQLSSAGDAAPAWTLDQAAGLVFAGLLVFLYVSSTQVDLIFARAQRRQLGLCEECGGLYEPGSCQLKGCPRRQGET